MDIQSHTTPDRLLRYAFLWSLIRMGIAVLSLFLGATPVLGKFVGYQVMMLAWLVSGVAALYLGYRWYTGGKQVFGGKVKKDLYAFLIMVVTGINLGYAGIGTNIGMNLTYSAVGGSLDDFVYKAVAILYALVAYYLYKRWKESGEKLF